MLVMLLGIAALSPGISLALDTAAYGAGRTIDFETNDNAMITRISADFGSVGFVSAAYSYDPAYRPATRTLGNGVVETCAYDARNLLTSKTATKEGALIHGNEYGFNEASNRTFERYTYQLGGGTERTWVNVSEYDALYQATRTKYRVPVASGTDPPAYDQIGTFERQQTFDLDLLYNRKSVTEDGALTAYNGNYTPDPFNRIQTIASPSDATPRNLAYDDNGNLTTDQFGRKFAWTPEGRLEAVRDEQENLIAVYLYDAQGLRLAKVLPDGSRTSYYYQGSEVYLEAGQDGAPTREFLIGNTLDHPIAVIQNDAVQYYHQMIFGTVGALTDHAGNVQTRYEYDLYGAFTIHGPDGTDLGMQPGVSDQPYYFTGRRYDHETGLFYYRNRYYSADLGLQEA